ncbi:MAG: hypothetical protein HY700_16825 [Gemmatimonadetes bacterium]|nr:hypothetical protein [Gemmatimonadota bacterium]
MDKKAFLVAAETGRGPLEAPGMHTRTNFYLMVDGNPVFLKEAHEVFDDSGNKRLDVRVAPLACGHVVDDPKETVELDGKIWCVRCIHRCPSCGSQILPGTGELVGQGTPEQAWYHRSCAEPHRRHAVFKRAAEEGLAVARLAAARQQVSLAEAQVQAAKTGIEKLRLDMRHQERRLEFEERRVGFEERRLELEDAREQAQRRLITAQEETAYANIRLQDANLELQHKRLLVEASQAAARNELERRALDSRLETEALQREIAKAGLDAARREKQLPGGRKQLP